MSTFARLHLRLLRATLAVAILAGGWLSAADGTGLVGTYFTAQNLTGTRVVRADATVDFAWGGAAPMAGIGADRFSVRWTGQVQAVTTESVTFHTVSDDGVRLWVNGTLLIDQWNDHGATEHQGSIALVAGQRYDLRMEFYENGGDAVAKLLWSSASIAKQVVPQAQLYPSVPAGTGSGLLATYYDNANFTGATVTRTDATVNFDWTGGSPASTIAVDTFSARWVGEVEARVSETFTFATTTDDGVRLWVGGQLVVNHWSDQSATERTGTIALSAGVRYPLVMEFYENGGAAVAKLSWSSLSTPKEVIPSTQLYPIAPVGTGTGLLATYFDNQDFTGTKSERTDATVNFDWAGGSPDAAIAADTFSARWTGEVEARTSETYTFTTTSDDGVRLWVDGQLLIDQWNDHGAVEHQGTIALVAGQRASVVMEFYERYGAAVAKLAWSTPTIVKTIIPTTQFYPAAAIGTGSGLLASYFDQLNFSGPALTRIDSVVDFDWAGGSPASAIAPDTFSVRWVGEVQAPFSETVTFQTVSDDGVRVWVGGQLLIDQWNDHGATTHSGSISMVAGQRYPLVMEFYENGGAAVARLRWTSARLPMQPVPQSQLYPALIPGTGTGLAATYYDNPDFSGTTVTRIDPVINFDWSAGSPAPSIGADTFSARWLGEVQPYVSELHTFTTISDDGIRVWIGEQLIIDHLSDHAANARIGTIALIGGQRYPLRVEYYENGGAAVAKLLWASPSTPAGVVPMSQLYPASSIVPTVATPVLTPAGGTFTEVVSVTLTTTTPGAIVRFTLDGSDPTEASAIASGPVTIAQMATLTARGFLTGWTTSSAANAQFIFKAVAPTMTPAGGSFGVPQAVALTTATVDGEIRYTLDGSYPTAVSALVNGPVTIDHSATLTARTFRAGWAPSDATSAVFSFNSAPTFATKPAAGTNPVTGTATQLTVLGADDGGEGALTYTWSTTGTSPESVAFSANSTNGAQSTTVTFTKPGSYTILVTITDAGNLSVTSAVTVNVVATITAIVVSPATASTAPGGTIQFAALARDQFAVALDLQPSFTWMVSSDGGSVSGSGLVTAPATSGQYVVTATSGVTNGTATFETNASVQSIAFAAGTSTVSEGDGHAAIQVILSQSYPQTVTVAYAVTGTAIGGGDDYYLPDGVLTFAPGETEASIPLNLRDDGTIEPDETIIVTLGSPTNATLGSPSIHVLTISDNDAVFVQVVASDPNATEAGHFGTLTVTRTGSVAAAMPVTFNVGGTAAKTADYADLGTAVIFPAGSSAMILPVTVAQDDLQEVAETVILTLVPGAGYAVGVASSATVTIADDDVVTIAAAPAITVEGTAPIPGQFVISRAGSTAASLSITVTVAGGTADAGDFDCAPTGTQVSMNVGQSTTVITITPTNDAIAEGAETVTATLIAGSGYTIGTDATAIITIIDDDVSTVTVAATTAVASEPATQGSFTVTRSALANTALEVTYGLAGSATNGVDYALLLGSVTIPANAVAATVAMVPLADSITELDETVILTLTPMATYNVGASASATATIADCTVTVVATDASADEPGGSNSTGAYTITRTGAASALAAALVVNVAWEGTAAPLADFTATPTVASSVIIPAGSTSVVVTITPTSDVLAEGNETAVLALRPGSYALASAGQGSVVITDATLTVTVDRQAINEAETLSSRFRITRSGSLAAAVSVPIAWGGTAAKAVPADFTLSATGTSVSIPAGSTFVEISATPINDTELEADETITLTIGSVGGYALTPALSATTTISDDDTPIVRIDVTEAAIGEAGMDAGVFTVTRSVVTAAALPVQVIRGGTAAMTTDFSTAPALSSTTTSIIIPANEASLQVVITPVNDSITEEAETVTLAVATGAGYRLADSAGSLSSIGIADDDTPRLSVIATAATAAEGGAGGVFTVTRTGNLVPPLAATIDFVGSTASNGSDFVAIPLSVALPSGSTTVAIYVVPSDDALSESAETVVLTLKTGSGYTVGTPAAATVIIADNDLPTVTIAAGTPAAEQGASVAGTFLITRTGSFGGDLPITVVFTGTAGSGDYVRTPAAIVIPDGLKAATISIAPINDAEIEGDETVIATIQSTSGYVIGTASSAALTIADDEKPTVIIAAADADAGESGADAGMLIVTRSAINGSAMVISYSVSGSATMGTDYFALSGTVTIPAEVADAAIALSVRDDATLEADELVVVDLQPGVGYELGAPRSASMVIHSDDLPRPEIAFLRPNGLVVDAFGRVPAGYDIIGLSATAAAAGVVVAGDINGSLFSVTATAALAGSADVSICFVASDGRQGPAALVKTVFATAGGGGSGGGGAGTSGDATGLPPETPDIAITIDPNNLTGIKQETINGKVSHYTSQVFITVKVTATTKLGTVRDVVLGVSDGRRFVVQGGSVQLPVFDDEIRLELRASAAVDHEGQTIVGFTKAPTVLIRDGLAPRVTYRLPKRDWPSFLDKLSDHQVPLIMSGPFDPRHGHGSSYLSTSQGPLLNGLGSGESAQLREKRQMNVYSSASFVLEASVEDLSGLRVDAEFAPKVHSPPTVTVAMAAEPTVEGGVRQVLNFTGVAGAFASMPEPTLNGAGKSFFVVALDVQDKAGNKAAGPSTQISLSQKTSATIIRNDADTSNIDTARLNHPYGSRTWNYWGGGASGLSDVVDLWQGSASEANRITGNILPQGIDVPAWDYWKENYVFNIGEVGCATLSARDLFGNISPGVSVPQALRNFGSFGRGGPIWVHDPPNPLVERGPFYPEQINIPNGNSGSLSASVAYTIGDDDSATEPLLMVDSLVVANGSVGTKPWQEFEWVATGDTVPTADDPNYYKKFRLEFNSLGVDSLAELAYDRDPNWSARHGIYYSAPVFPGSDGAGRYAQPVIGNMSSSWSQGSAIRRLVIREPTLGLFRSAHMDAAAIWPASGGYPGANASPGPYSDSIAFAGWAPMVGLQDMRYAVSSASGYDGFWYDNTARGWVRGIQVRPDIVVAGRSRTITVASYFLDGSFAPEQFNRLGDHVHFVRNGQDITVPIARADSVGADERDNSIIIRNQRFFANDTSVSSQQTLSLELEVGKDVATGLYDVDVNLGSVKAYSDALSKEHKGSNSSHRIAGGLRVVALEWVKASDPADPDSAGIATIATESAVPVPVITLDPIERVQAQGDMVLVTVTGVVTDPLADLVNRRKVSQGGGDIEKVTITASTGGSWTFDLSASTEGRAGFWRPYPFRGSFSKQIQIPVKPNGVTITATTSVNAVGSVATASLQMSFAPLQLPGLGGGVVAVGGTGGSVQTPVLLSGFEPRGATPPDRLVLTIGDVADTNAVAMTRDTSAGIPVGSLRYLGTGKGTVYVVKLNDPLVLTDAEDLQPATIAIGPVVDLVSEWKVALLETGPITGIFRGHLPLTGGPVTGGGGGDTSIVTWIGSASGVRSAPCGWMPNAVRYRGFEDLPDTAIGSVVLGERNGAGGLASCTEFRSKDGWRYAATADGVCLSGVARTVGRTGKGIATTDGQRLTLNNHHPDLSFGASLTMLVRNDFRDRIQTVEEPMGLECIWSGPDGIDLDHYRSPYLYAAMATPSVRIDDAVFADERHNMLTIRGHVHDPLAVIAQEDPLSVLVGGLPAKVESDGTFKKTVTMRTRAEMVSVVASNAFGGTATQIVLVSGMNVTGINQADVPLPVRYRYVLGSRDSSRLKNLDLDHPATRLRIERRLGSRVLSDMPIKLDPLSRTVMATRSFIVSRADPEIDPEALKKWRNGVDGSGVFMPIDSLDEDLWLVIDGPSKPTLMEIKVPRAGLAIESGERQLAWFDREVTPGSYDEDVLRQNRKLRVVHRNLSGAVSARFVHPGEKPISSPDAVNVSSAASLSGGNLVLDGGSAVADAPTMNLALGRSVQVFSGIRDRAGMPLPPVPAVVFSANKSFPYAISANYDLRHEAGLPSGHEPSWGGISPVREKPKADVGPVNAPDGVIVRLEVNQQQAQDEEAMAAFLKKYELTIMGSHQWRDNATGNLLMSIWVQADHGRSLDRMWSDAMRGKTDMVVIQNCNLTPAGLDPQAMVVPEAKEVMGHYKSFVPKAKEGGKDDTWAIEHARLESVLRNTIHRSHNKAIETMYVGANAPAKTIHVIDCRHLMSGLKRIYDVKTSGGLRNTRMPFEQAGIQRGPIAGVGNIMNGDGYPNGSESFTIKDYTYVDHSNRRAFWWWEDDFSPSEKHDNYMPQIKYAVTHRPAEDIEVLLSERAWDGVVISIEGFNNGDGDVRDRSTSLVVDSSTTATTTSYALPYTYWPRLQTTLRQQGLNNHLILHVKWSGTYSEYTYALGVRAVATLGFARPRDVAGAFFNCDYSTAHFVGRYPVYGLLRDISNWSRTAQKRMPISVIAESTGARACTSALERVWEDTAQRSRFQLNGDNQISVVWAHPALRQSDINSDLLKRSENPADMNYIPNYVPEELANQAQSGFIPYSRSPLLKELEVLGVDVPDNMMARMLLFHSPFDKPGLAFLFAQSYVPDSLLNGRIIGEQRPTAMIGRHGLMGSGSVYDPVASKVKIRSVFAGQGSPDLGDFWHVDLMGWTLKNEAFQSRNTFEVNIPSPEWPLESHFNEPDSWWGTWANTTYNGTTVTHYMDSPPYNWLVMNRSRIDNAWSQVATFIRTGFATPGSGE